MFTLIVDWGTFYEQEPRFFENSAQMNHLKLAKPLDFRVNYGNNQEPLFWCWDGEVKYVGATAFEFMMIDDLIEMNDALRGEGWSAMHLMPKT